MRKIDHIRKVVYIIVGILTIISLVFSLYKKIGKAASSDSSIFFNGFPMYVGGKIASADSYNNSIIQIIIDDSIQRFSSYVSGNPIYVTYNSSQNRFIVNHPRISDGVTNATMPNGLSSNNSVITFYQWRSFSYDADTGQYLTVSSNTNQSLNLFSVLENFQGTYLYKLNTVTTNYPIYVYNAENLKFSNGVQIFTKYQENLNPSGHSKGGVLANYQSSFDLLEDSSDVPKVDITSPDDSSSVPAWLGKILNGLGVIGNSIQSGVLTIGDYIGTLGENIGEFFNSVGEKIDAIKDSIDSFFAWVTESPNNETILSNIQPYLESNTMIQGFISSKNAIQGVYSDITGVNAKTSSQMKWTIPFNLPGLSNNFTATIDFGWYENIRSIVQPILIMIISVSFILSLIRSIPGILHGNSPEGDT